MQVAREGYPNTCMKKEIFRSNVVSLMGGEVDDGMG
jgi:hypothetical protein